MDAEQAIARYAAGWFPMDDDGAAPELPWYAVRRRAVFGLDAAARDALRRRVRRSLRASEDLELRVDADFAGVLERCARPRSPGDGLWITPRLQELYRTLHGARWAHSFELVDPESDSSEAGILAVVLGRAAMLESMSHRRPHAGNALLSRTLDRLADAGIELCDIQMLTPHTERLGAHEIPRRQYEARLAAALD